jgi:uncharacterized protein YecE (DUF72 family)
MRSRVPTHNIRIGTSGWSYPSGQGSWNGLFYPPRGRAHRQRGFDELSYYAEHFDTVEVNSSFYGIPTPEVTQRWVDRTPAGFEFSMKLFQKFTHPRMFTNATGQANADVTNLDIDRVRAALSPLQDAGKLGVLLAQFPPSFKNDTSTRDYLTWLLTVFADCPVAVELRHASWSADVGTTLSMLNEFGAAWAQIDEPKFRFSIAQNQLPNVENCYYMRLHGRNAAKWWKHDRAEERYNYLYSASELKPFAETTDAASRLVKKLYLYLNNHFAAKAVANASVLKHQLDIPVTGEFRQAFVDRYPELKGIVQTRAGLLS